MFALLAVAHAEDLYVSSNERGAAIFVNGVDTGARTPATVPGVKPGQVLVAVEGNCSRGEALVNVLSGLTTRVSIVAEEEPGSLVIVPVPATARIEVDGSPFTGAPGIPYGVSCGTHTVRAAAEGYVTAVLTVEVGMGQSASVPISLLTLGTGSIELSVQPRAALLFLDGKVVGSDAASLPSVYQGVHTISAELDGYQTAEKQVVVEDGSAQAFHFELVRSSARKQKSTVTALGGEPEEASSSGPSEREEREAEEREAEEQAAEEAAAKAKADAAAKAKADAAAKAKADAAAKAKADAAREAEEREADEREAEERAAREAEEREAEEQAAEEAAAKAKAEAASKAKADAAAKAKAEAAARAKADADAKAKADAAAKAKADADARAREEREAEEREAAEQDARDAEAREEAEREAAEREAEAREAEEREAAEREAEAKARAKARAKAEAEAREADRRTIDEEGDPEARAADGPPVGKIVGGVSMLAGGLGSGAFSVLAYTQATRAYTDYNNKVENAGDDKQRQRLADDYYDSTVVPRRNLFYGTAAAGGLLLAGGIVVLAIDDRLPTLAPAPGGGMLLWSGRF